MKNNRVTGKRGANLYMETYFEEERLRLKNEMILHKVSIIEEKMKNTETELSSSLIVNRLADKLDDYAFLKAKKEKLLESIDF